MSVRLSQYAGFTTKRTDDFCRFIARLLNRQIQVLGSRDFSFTIHAAPLELLMVSAVEVRGGTLKTRTVDEGYILTRFDTGKMQRRLDGQTNQAFGPGDGALMRPGREVATILQPGDSHFAAVTASFTRALLEREAAMLIGEPVSDPLEITGGVLNLGPSTNVGQLVRMLFETLESETGNFLATQSLAGTGLQRRLIHALIEKTANNYQPLLDRRFGGPARRHTTIAEEFIQASLYKGVTIADVVAAVGVSVRTLRDDCHRIHGMALDALIRQHKLHAAYWRFMDPRPGETVASIVRELGFNSPSRFAFYYWREFRGEWPLDTLQRGRKRRGI